MRKVNHFKNYRGHGSKGKIIAIIVAIILIIAVIVGIIMAKRFVFGTIGQLAASEIAGLTSIDSESESENNENDYSETDLETDFPNEPASETETEYTGATDTLIGRVIYAGYNHSVFHYEVSDKAESYISGNEEWFLNLDDSVKEKKPHSIRILTIMILSVIRTDTEIS
ncbi:MAG: hypothetical protein LIP12_13325 [Clostridiales bacterium]|nr:hypothetical protein [Clostridiales bacterium]